MIPHDITSEICVLGSMILESSVIPSIRGIVSGDDFFRPAHMIIFGALCKMFEAGSPIDLPLLKAELTNASQLERVGGVDYLVDLIEGVPNTANADYYAKEVKGLSSRRKVIQLANSLRVDAEDRSSPIDMTLSGAQTDLSHIDNLQVITPIPQHTEKIITDAENHIKGLSLGNWTLDDATGGLRGGNYFIMAARPGCGKTTVALNLAVWLCKLGRRVIFFSCEMSEGELLQRILSIKTLVAAGRIRNGSVDDLEIGKLREGKVEIDKWKLQIDCRSNTLGGIATALRRFQFEIGHPDLVIIDYFQLLRSDGKSRYERYSDLSMGLKELAVRQDVPIMVLSQFNRPERGKEQSLPTKFQLKETGSLEQDADFVLLLHPVRNEGDDVIMASLDKNRHGQAVPWPDGDFNRSIQFKWFPAYYTIESI